MGEVIKFVEAADQRQFKYFTQREENRHKELLVSESTKRIAIGSVLVTVFAAFTYSTLTGDSNLASQVIMIIVAGFGGLGIRDLFQRKED